MAQQGAEQDKSEKATPFKLEEARRQGQVAKSHELNSLAILGAGLLTALAFAPWAIERMLALSASLLIESGNELLAGGFPLALLRDVATGGIVVIAPLLALTAVGGVAANLLQTGPVLSWKPITPNFGRLNPAEGLKRIFSARTLYEGGKAVIKISMLAGVLYLIIQARLPEIFGLYKVGPEQWQLSLLGLSASILFLLIIPFLGLALLDFAYVRWEYQKQMRMSRRELKEEAKRREGDPQVRTKRRELQRSLRQRAASTGRVGEADVLITNPSHLAVALRYRRKDMPAPKVVAKGAGDSARIMRREAFKFGVPVVENKTLARDLFGAVDIDQYISERHYRPVALILRKYKRARQEGGGVR